MNSSRSTLANHRRQQSWFVRANPAVKFVLTILLASAGIFIQPLAALVLISLFYSALYFYFATLKRRWLVNLFLLSLALSLLSGVNLILFGYGEDVIWQFAWWKISYSSLHSGAIVIFRTLLLSMLGLLFSSSTNPTLFSYALMQQLRLPAKYGYGCLVMLRLFPLMLAEYHNLRQALLVRGLRPCGLRGRWRWLQRVTIILLAQSIRLAYRSALAIATKQFDPSASRSYYYQTTLSVKDVYLTILLFGVSLALFLIGSHWF